MGKRTLLCIETWKGTWFNLTSSARFAFRGHRFVFTPRAFLLMAKIARGVRRDSPTAAFDQRDVGTLCLIANELLELGRAMKTSQ